MPRTVGLLQNMCRQVIYELFLPLTGKNISWKMRYTKEHFEAENLKKKNIELHENFTGFYKKGIEALYEIQTP